MDVRIDSANIKVGMYVTELDRPWEDTSFMFQGFLISSEAQVLELRAQCSYIIVSEEKSENGMFEIKAAPVEKKIKPTTINKPIILEEVLESKKNPSKPISGFFSSIKQIGKEILSFKAKEIELPPLKTAYTIQFEEDERKAEIIRRKDVRVIRKHYAETSGETQQVVDYSIKSSIEEELISAKKATDRLTHEVASSFMLEITNADLSDRIEVAKELLSDVVESIIRNPSAMLLISNLKNNDNSHYRHALDVAIMMVSFGRQLGIPKEELNHIALGGLLHDLGKTKVPNDILKKPQRLNAEEYSQVQMHVEYGHRMIDDIPNIHPITRQIILHHHERFDGNGYPEQLSDGAIGLYGSMAGIVETYATMTANQPYASARSSAKAVGVLVALRGKAFQAELVDQFIQVVGVYPTGSIVQLSTKEIGIVTRQNRLWRLKPLVTLILDEHGQKLPQQKTIDLAREQPDNKVISIITELPSGSFGIDPKDYFI